MLVSLQSDGSYDSYDVCHIRSLALSFQMYSFYLQGHLELLSVMCPMELQRTRLCNQWPYTYTSLTIFSLTHITQTHTHILNYTCQEHIVNLSHVWQTQHLSDPHPHLSHVCVYLFLWFVYVCDVCVWYEYDMCACVCASEYVWLSAQARSFIKKWGTAAQQKLCTEQWCDKV